MSYLDNLYKVPIDEGTHSYKQIYQYLINRRNREIDKTANKSKEAINRARKIVNRPESLGQNELTDPEFRAIQRMKKITQLRFDKGIEKISKRYSNLFEKLDKELYDKDDESYFDDKKARGYFHRPNFNNEKSNTSTNNSSNLGKGLAATGAVGLTLAGLHRYATKNPKSYLGRKLATLKARFSKK